MTILFTIDDIIINHVAEGCSRKAGSSNYNCRLVELPGGDILYFDGKGGRDRYIKGSGELYTPPRGRFTEFKKIWDGTFLLKLANGVLKYFDSFGRLVKIQDRNSNKMEFYYNLAGQLETVMDTMGRIIVFEYYDNDPQQVDGRSGRLKSISDYFVPKVDYTYDAVTGDLVGVDTCRSPIFHPGINWMRF